MSLSRSKALGKLGRCHSLADLGEAFGDKWVGGFQDPVLARLYDALLSNERSSMVRDCVEDFCAAIGKPPIGTRILDFGCGAGHVLLGLAERFSNRGYTFLGLDPSDEMIALAEKNRARQRGRRSIQFRHGRLLKRESDVGRPKADIVLIRNAVSWMGDASAEIGAALRCLNPGGMILIRELRRDAHIPLLKERIRACLAFEANGVPLCYPPAAMVAAYRAALTPLELIAILSKNGASAEILHPAKKDSVKTEPWGVEMFVQGQVGERRW